jgi:hypothetical protein
MVVIAQWVSLEIKKNRSASELDSELGRSSFYLGRLSTMLYFKFFGKLEGHILAAPKISSI